MNEVADAHANRSARMLHGRGKRDELCDGSSHIGTCESDAAWKTVVAIVAEEVAAVGSWRSCK